MQQEYQHVARTLKRDLMADRLDTRCIVTEDQINGLSVIKRADQWALSAQFAFPDTCLSLKRKISWNNLGVGLDDL